MLKTEIRGAERAMRDLERFAKGALPHAARDALNRAAFDTRKAWQREIRQSFTLRNRYTERSVRVEKARGVDIDRMFAVVGSVAPYMGDQERGGTVGGRSGKKGIPGPVAAGQPAGAKRVRLVRKGRRLSAIRADNAQNRGSRRQRNAIALAIARRKNRQFVLLERPKGGRGLFLITGGKRRLRVRLLWDFSKSAVRVPREPTLERTLNRMERRMARIHHASVLRQLKRNRVFGY